MLLAGDIGGTKTNLAIYSLEGGSSAPQVEATFRSSEYPDLETIVGEFLSRVDFEIGAASFLLYFKALRAVNVPAELHIYEVGGHGYGIIPTEKPVATWHHRLAEWMKQRGLLDM